MAETNSEKNWTPKQYKVKKELVTYKQLKFNTNQEDWVQNGYMWKPTSTEHFMDLGKLNLLMVLWF